MLEKINHAILCYTHSKFVNITSLCFMMYVQNRQKGKVMLDNLSQETIRVIYIAILTVAIIILAYPSLRVVKNIKSWGRNKIVAIMVALIHIAALLYYCYTMDLLPQIT